MAISKLVVVFGAYIIMSTTVEAELPDCVCNTTWMNDGNGLCRTSPIEMKGCPDLETISLCERDPVQSWCYVTEPCKQMPKIKNHTFEKGYEWAYCDARTQEPQLEYCTCKGNWFLHGNETSGSAGSCQSLPLSVSGCPSEAKVMQCDPNFETGDQLYCETEQEECYHQVDDNSLSQTNHKMVGKGYAYCNHFDNEPELPRCECASKWHPTKCSKDSNVNPSDFKVKNCPSVNAIKQCHTEYTEEDYETYCRTTKDLCLEQTYSIVNEDEDMINDGWVTCDPESQEAVYPECECLDTWQHKSSKCTDHPMTMFGCPDLEDLWKCDHQTASEQSWCDTTYNTCEQQNYQSDADGWSYCDPETGYSEFAACECKDSWMNGFGECDGDREEMRGCPTLETIRECQPEKKQSWCKTMDQYCDGQSDHDYGSGRVDCDPVSQLPETWKPNVGKLVVSSMSVTLLIGAVIILAAIYVYKKHLENKRRGYLDSAKQSLRANDSEL